jgi:hypothetical protein
LAHSCTIFIQVNCCVVGHSSTNATRNHCWVAISSNNEFGPSVQMISDVPLLPNDENPWIQCCATMSPSNNLYSRVWWPGLKNSPTVTHSCRKRRLKWVPSPWSYSWATLSPGIINKEAWSSRLGVGRWTNNPAL